MAPREGMALPWEVDNYCIVVDADGASVAECEWSSDAAYLVDACNNYDRVLAERDALLAAARLFVSTYDDTLTEPTYGQQADVILAMREAIAQVEATRHE